MMKKHLLLFLALAATTLSSQAQTDAINIIPSGNVGIGSTAPAQKLDVQGNIKLDDNMMVEGNTSFRVFRNLGSYSAAGAAAGAFVINTSIPWNSAFMFRVKVEGYFYDATSPFETTIGAYMYTGNDFYNYGYVNVGANNLAVRLCRRVSSNTIAIILGAEGSSYSYPKLTISSFMQGHTAPVEAHADGWAISQITALTGYDYLVSVPNVTTLPSGSGNYIQNQIASAQGANFWVNAIGRAAAFQLNNANTSLTEGNGDALRMTTPTGYIDIGSQNASWAHLETDRPRYYFNKGITVDQGLIGSYSQDLQLQTSGTTRITALNSNGFVGIGSVTPGAQLDVQGASGLRIGNSTYDANLVFGNNASWKSGIRVYDNNEAEMRIWTNQAAGEIVLTNGYNGDQSTVLPTDGLWVKNNRVGLGNFSATAISRKLEVNGDIKLAYGYQIYFGENVGANGKIGINFHTDADNNYYIGKPAGAWTQPLHIAFYTGVKIGAHTAYGGTKFYNSSDMATEIMSVGNGDNHVRIGGYLFAGYVNTTDNAISSGVTGIMTKQGDNYMRTSNAAGVLSFLGVTAPTGDNLGNHTATTTLQMAGNNINNVNDIYAIQNYGTGLVGVYTSDRYQNVWAMGTSWRLAANGTTPGNLYGLAWTHTNVGGQSKAGLSHQMLVMENGVTKVAIGSGIWTNYTSWVPFIYDTDNTGYYLDANSTSRQSVVITDENYTYGWFRNYSQNTGLYSQVNGNHWYASSSAYWNIGGGNGTNTGIIFRNGHQGAIQGYSYSDGSGFGLLHSGGGWAVRTQSGVTEAYGSFYASTSFIPFIYDRDNTGYYMDPNSTSRMYYGDYNYLHTQVNDSWFPYTGNNWNYFRGNSYITNAHWYDENNTGYYFNVDNTSRMAYVYQGVGANNVGGWTSGRIQTESTSDGHQYHPVTGNWGYVGTSGQYWYYMYSNNFVDPSRREIKRNIIPVESNLSDFVMDDIDKIKPSFYKYQLETDEMEKGNEPKYRPNMHLGVILDESPDYIQDQAFSGIDIYAIATMGIVGVKHNREEIKQIKEAIGLTTKKMTINDFGNEELNGLETWVPFSEEFLAKNNSNATPIVTVTPNQTGVSLSVIETSSKGFKVATNQKTDAITFNWIAMAKVDVKAKENGEQIPADLASQLKVDESRKAPIKAYWEEQKRIGQTEHARQAAEHDSIVEIGRSNYMETVNPVDGNIAKRAEEAKSKYIYVPEDGPAKAGNLGDPNPSKEGAPKVQDLTPTPSDPINTVPPPADPNPGTNIPNNALPE